MSGELESAMGEAKRRKDAEAAAFNDLKAASDREDAAHANHQALLNGHNPSLVARMLDSLMQIGQGEHTQGDLGVLSAHLMASAVVSLPEAQQPGFIQGVMRHARALALDLVKRAQERAAAGSGAPDAIHVRAGEPFPGEEVTPERRYVLQGDATVIRADGSTDG